MATGLSISLKPSSNSKNTRDRNTVLDIQQQGPKRDGGDAWTCVGSGDARGEGGGFTAAGGGRPAGSPRPPGELARR